MTECVACNQPLEIEVDFSDEEDVDMGESSTNAQNKQKVPDDIHLVRLSSLSFHFQSQK